MFAALLTALASVSKIGADLLETLTSMFNPLPSIALLPLALIWFGLGDGSVIFVLVHAVLWSVALNTHAGFRALSPTLRMVGQNYGLSAVGFITQILIPGAFPSILTGLKVGWAFAWRTLIAAELVFGASSGSGGIGWYIFEHKNQLLIPERVCRPADGDSVRPVRRARDLQDDRRAHRAAVGDADLKAGERCARSY